jgi:preprotein translocase subunit Sec63
MFTQKREAKQTMGKDYYKILGVDRGCNDGDIKKAYKKLVRVYLAIINM